METGQLTVLIASTPYPKHTNSKDPEVPLSCLEGDVVIHISHSTIVPLAALKTSDLR